MPDPTAAAATPPPAGPPPVSWQEIIGAEATKQKVDPRLALAVAHTESGFDPSAKSPKGALGLMQLMPETAKRHGVDPTDPYQNIKGGVAELKSLLDANGGDVRKALALYNGSPQASPEVTNPYVEKVLGQLKTMAAPSEPATTPPPGPQVDPKSGKPINLPGQIAQRTNDHLTRPPSKWAIPGAPDLSQPMLGGTEGVQRIIGGGIGSTLAGAAVTAAFPELGAAGLGARALAALAPPAGAALGGAGVAALQGAPPSDVLSAGATQGALELGGQAIAWPLKSLGRRMLATGVGKAANERLASMLEGARTAWESAFGPGTPSPQAAGQAVESAAQGPAKRSFDQIGQAVQDAAKTGPPVNIVPVKAKLESMATGARPSFIEGEQNQGQKLLANGATSPERLAAIQQSLQQAGVSLEPSHPLPGALGMLQDAPDTVSFEDAHKMKRILDNAVDWDSPAKGQIKQVTKGIRTTLRGAMSDVGHEPYEAATAAYNKVAPLFQDGNVAALHRVADTDPESLVRTMSGKQPTELQMLQSVLLDHAPQGGDPAAGQAAWNGVRAAFTRNKVIQPGIEHFEDTIGKMDPDFVKTMYSGSDGQTVFRNLQDLSGAFQDAKQKLVDLGKSSVVKSANSGRSAAENAALLIAHPHGFYAPVRLADLLTKGPKVNDLVQWAAYSPARTQAVVKALSGPQPGVALSNIARTAGIALGAGQDEEPPLAVSHGQFAASPPPGPTTPPPR